MGKGCGRLVLGWLLSKGMGEMWWCRIWHCYDVMIVWHEYEYEYE